MTVQSFNIGGKPAEAVYLGDIKLWPAAGGIDPATAKIVWGTDQVITFGAPSVIPPPNPGFGTVPVALPAEANPRVTLLPNGRLRIQADPWTYTGTASGGFLQSQDPNPLLVINAPITWHPDIGKGEEMLRLEWVLKNITGGSIASSALQRGPGYYPAGCGLSKPGADGQGSPNPKDFTVPAIGAESSGLGVAAISGKDAILHDHLTMTFWPKYQEAAYADGSHPLTATVAALDMEFEYKLVRQVAAAP
jgi:hypothetical protein